MLGPMPPGARADLLIEVGNRRTHAGLVRLGDRRTGPLVPQRVQDRHVLVGAEHQIPRRHRIGTGRAAELLAGAGVLPGKQPLERRRRTLTLQAKRQGAATVEHPWRLAVAGQVLLAVAGDLAGVVVLPPGRQLVQIRRHDSPTRPGTR
jgi:hypothetical protein